MTAETVEAEVEEAAVPAVVIGVALLRVGVVQAAEAAIAGLRQWTLKNGAVYQPWVAGHLMEGQGMATGADQTVADLPETGPVHHQPDAAEARVAAIAALQQWILKNKGA